MPLTKTNYRPSFFFRNGYVSTIFSGLFRRVKLLQKRERISTKDGDFLDLDWSYSSKISNKLVVILHGLEGSGQRPYVTGVARYFNANNFDAVCVNFRGCSGELNLKYETYHSGQTKDLKTVLNHIENTKTYEALYLNGFSLGGNILLKYLGEGNNFTKLLKAAVAVSVPCDLSAASKELHKWYNKPYHIYFMIYLKNRLRKKQRQFPELLSRKEFKAITNLKSLDEIYTAKAHGFLSAEDYYKKSSSLFFLEKITIPTLLINALNDSFLSSSCYPYEAAKNNSKFFLETPFYGGHVGFVSSNGVYYNERRALDFILNFQ